MLRISQNIGKFANQFRHTNHYQYFTSQILSQSRCSPQIETNRSTQQSVSDANSCGCAIRINQRVGLCQLGRNNENSAGDAPLRPSCLWVVDKATPWFKEQREQWNSNCKLHSLSDRCKLLGITSAAEASKAQMLAMQKPILDAQQQRLDPNNFKHISPEFLSLLREHDNLCLLKNPFYGLPQQENDLQRAPTRSSVTLLNAAQQPYNRGTTMCRKMKDSPSNIKDSSSKGKKPRSKCKISSYPAKRRREPCQVDGSKQKIGDPHVPSYNRARKANRILKSLFSGSPNENRRSRRERYAAEMAWRATSKPSGFFRHSHNINARRKERRSSRSRDRHRRSESGFHRHPIDHLRNLKRCDYTTPYYNKHSKSCASLRSRPSSSSMRTSSQNMGFHRRTYGRCVEDTSTRRTLNQPSGGVNRAWDYGGTESHGYKIKTLRSGVFRHTYQRPIGSLRKLKQCDYTCPYYYKPSRSCSSLRSYASSSGMRSSSPKLGAQRCDKQMPRSGFFRHGFRRASPTRSRSQSRSRSRSRSRSKSSVRSSKSTDGNIGRRCNNEPPVRQIYMKPKEVEMRQSRSHVSLKHNKDRGSEDQFSKNNRSRDRFDRDPGSKERRSKNRDSNDRLSKKRGSKDPVCQEQSSKNRGSKVQAKKGSGSKDRDSKDRNSKDHGSKDHGSKDHDDEDPDMSDCCEKPPKKKRSSSKKREPQVKFRKRYNQYYNEPHVHGYGSDEDYYNGKRTKSEGSRTKTNDRRQKDNKKKKGSMACRRYSDIDIQTDYNICYPPLPISKTQKQRMIDEVLNRFMPEPEEKNCTEQDKKSKGRKRKGESGSDDGRNSRSSILKSRKRKGESGSDDGRSSRSSISINCSNSSKSYDSLGPYGNKWQSRTASQAPRLPMASKKCGRKLIRDPAAPPRPKLKKKKSRSSCRSSGSSNRSTEDVVQDKRAYMANRHECFLRARQEENECMWGRPRRKAPLLRCVEGKHRICHKDSTDWTRTTKQYPNHLRKAGMEQRCENLVKCRHRCATQGMLCPKISQKEQKQREHRHDLCRSESQDWMNAKANYPLSYQLARCKAEADAKKMCRHRDRTEQILASGYAPHKQARDSKAKRMQRQQEELAKPKCASKPKPYPLRPEFYAPKRDFSQDWEALNQHEKCLPPMQRLQLFRKQHEREAACRRSAAEQKKHEHDPERPPRRPLYDPGEEYEQRTLRAEETKRCKQKRKRANNAYFMESDNDYYREAEEEERARRARPKPKPCPPWHGTKPSVTIVSTPESKYSYLKHRPTPPPKPKKKYDYDDIDDDEYRQLKRRRGERRWFDEVDSPTVVHCMNDRAERRCVYRESRPPRPCLTRPEYTLGQSKRK